MDKVSEMLTKIRNASLARHKVTTVGFSNLKLAIAKILEKEGFVASVSREEIEGKEVINIGLKYRKISNTEIAPVINGIRKVSKLGQRIYIKSKDIKRVKNNFGSAIFSTSKGIMTGEESKKIGLGGEYICEVW